ncbi:MAG: Trk system potassium transporter TrkA [Treponema sp.]|jgi:trk system potassium uptake protein TrkA|nr:Trk system potassium transporter TrkA [Treponema sp.]
MHIIIVGAGMVGTQLARHLIQAGHDVSIIESGGEEARHASNRLDCLVLHDRGNSLAALEDAGIDRAGALVCVTGSDELNMIICGLAASRRPDLLKIARVRNGDYTRLNQKAPEAGGQALGIDRFVHPDLEVSRSVLNAVEHGAVGDILAFADSSYGMGSVEIGGGSPFDGLVLKDFRAIVKGECLITLVERKGESILPGGSTVLARGDRVHILAPEEELGAIFALAGMAKKPLRTIGIVGGGRIGALIAGGLAGGPAAGQGFFFSFLRMLGPRSRRRITIIERDYGLCKELSARFPDALILNEDISDESFISEERIGDLDLIITATDHQELNMIAALYLKSRGVDRAIALVTGGGYAAIARHLGVDVVIPVKSVVVDSILTHLMGGGVRGVHRLGEDESIGIIELEVGKGAPAAEKGIAEFSLPGGGLVMLVNREGRSFIPRGDYVFNAGDRVILIVNNGNETEINRFFGAS